MKKKKKLHVIKKISKEKYNKDKRKAAAVGDGIHNNRTDR